MKHRRSSADKTSTRQLLAVGCPVPREEDCSDPAPELVVEVRDPRQTVAFDYRSSTEFVLDLRIRNDSYSRLQVEHYVGDPPWSHKNFIWLTDLQGHMRQRQAYLMPSGREVPYGSVLNHCLFGKWFEPGESREGLLLAWSMFTRMPTDCLHGELFPFQIVLIDQYGRSHVSFIRVRADRSATMRQPNLSKPVRSRLYGGSPQEKAAFNYRAPWQAPIGEAGGGKHDEKGSGLKRQTTEPRIAGRFN